MTAIDSTKVRFKLLSVKEVEELPDPIWLIDDVLPASSIAMLYGAPGVGKTFIALDAALSVATARPWFGHETVPGAVVYVVAEGVAGLSKRLKAWFLEEDQSEIPHLYLLPDTPQLAESADVEQLLTDLRAQVKEPVSLLVIDTMARCFVGKDENSAKDAGTLVDCVAQLRKELGCTILLIHHTTKHGDAERGSSALRGACDTMISAESSSSGVITLCCEKQKDAAAFMVVKVRLEPVGDSCVVRACDAESGDALLKPNDLNCLIALSGIEGTQGATVGVWQKAAPVKNSTFYRCLKRLSKEGFVSNRDKLYRLTDKGKAEVLSHPTHSQQLS